MDDSRVFIVRTTGFGRGREYVTFEIDGKQYQATVCDAYQGQLVDGTAVPPKIVVELHRVNSQQYRSISVNDKRHARIARALLRELGEL